MPKLVDVIIVNGGHLAKPSGFYRFFSLFRDGGEGGGPPPATTPRDHPPGGPWGKLKGGFENDTTSQFHPRQRLHIDLKSQQNLNGNDKKKR